MNVLMINQPKCDPGQDPVRSPGGGGGGVAGGVERCLRLSESCVHLSGVCIDATKACEAGGKLVDGSVSCKWGTFDFVQVEWPRQYGVVHAGQLYMVEGKTSLALLATHNLYLDRSAQPLWS